MPTIIEMLPSAPSNKATVAGRPAAFDIRFSLFRKHGVMVPLGVPSAKNKPTNPYFQFKYSIQHQRATSIMFALRDVNGKLSFQMEVPQPYLEPGDYLLSWDGFDSSGVFDSQLFNSAPLKASLIAVGPDGTKVVSLFFAARYHVVPWLDVRISQATKSIDITLRTNFNDGGEGAISRQDLPETAVRPKSFETLLQLAKEGINYYWSRNNKHPAGKNIVLPDGSFYEVFVETVNTPSQAIKSPKIVYQTNARSRRSRNWELSRILFYNTGNLLRAGRWYQKTESQAEADFKQVAAHEIGHEILLAYGGHRYSKSHKGSSTVITQRPLGNYLYPPTGEIDLMLYYATDPQHPFPVDYYSRNIASETDVRSLLWLAQISYQLV